MDTEAERLLIFISYLKVSRDDAGLIPEYFNLNHPSSTLENNLCRLRETARSNPAVITG